MSEFFDASRRLLFSRRGAILAAAGVGVALLLFLLRGATEQGRRAPAASAIDLMAAELRQAAERANICTAANAVGVGLRGEYFADADLRGPAVLVRVDDVVDFDASIRQHAETGAQKVSSVRWAGWIKSPISGQYRFHADAPGMKVLVARNVVAGADAPPDAKVDMAAGRFYPVEVVVSQITDSPTRIRLEWTAPHGARYVVPRALLQLPTDTVPITDRE